MSANQDISGVAKAVTLAELVGKVSIALVGTFYVLGICVVNIHLNRFGAFSLGLFRLSYITAGIWTTMPIFLAVSGVYSMMGAIMAKSEDPFGLINLLLWSGREQYVDHIPLTAEGEARSKELSSWARKDEGKRMAWAFPFVLILMSIFLWQLGIRPRAAWLWTLLTGLLVAMSILPLHFNLSIRRPRTGAESINLGFMAVTAGFFLLIHVSVFANRSYGSIPSFAGGGSPKIVQLVIVEEHMTREALEQAGVHFNVASNRTEDVGLLFVTDEDYLILVGDDDRQKAISVRREIVKATAYDER